VRIARDPFFPKLAVGSGLAYSNGFPMGIEGSSPIILQAQQFIFNRQQTYLVAQSREEARGATLASAGKRDEMAFRGVRDMRGASPPRGPCAATGCGLI
jgi:hypothetical protein